MDNMEDVKDMKIVNQFYNTMGCGKANSIIVGNHFQEIENYNKIIISLEKAFSPFPKISYMNSQSGCVTSRS